MLQLLTCFSFFYGNTKPVIEYTFSKVTREHLRLFHLETAERFLWNPVWGFQRRRRKKGPEAETLLECSCLPRLFKLFPKPTGRGRRMCWGDAEGHCKPEGSRLPRNHTDCVRYTSYHSLTHKWKKLDCL